MNEILGPEKILTPQELADRLKVPVFWIYEKTRSRSRDPLPVIRLARYMRFDWPHIVEWIERHRQVARPQDQTLRFTINHKNTTSERLYLS